MSNVNRQNNVNVGQVLLVLLAFSHCLFARGGGFGGGGREFSYPEREVTSPAETSVRVSRQDNGDREFSVNRGDKSYSGQLVKDGSNSGSLSLQTPNHDYNFYKSAPTGFHPGSVWNGTDYVPVETPFFQPYVAPAGAYCGWSIITQPNYVQYPSYASFPVETAVEAVLSDEGYYTGPIDGSGDNLYPSILAYQNHHGLVPTGTIDSQLLESMGISASAP